MIGSWWKPAPTGLPSGRSRSSDGSSAIRTSIRFARVMTEMLIVMAMIPSSINVSAALRPFGFLKAGTPLLIASTPVSAAHPDENARSSRNANAKPVRPSLNGSSASMCRSAVDAQRQVAAEVPHETPGGHAEDGDHEQVGGHREGPSGLTDATQVHGHQEDHGRHRDRDLVSLQVTDAGGGVLGGGRDRHGDREHVVDQQGAADAEPGHRAEVGRRDLVVASTALVGLHVLPVREHHHGHDGDDGDRDLPGVRVRRQPGQGQHQEDLVG